MTTTIEALRARRYQEAHEAKHSDLDEIERAVAEARAALEDAVASAEVARRSRDEALAHKEAAGRLGEAKAILKARDAFEVADALNAAAESKRAARETELATCQRTLDDERARRETLAGQVLAHRTLEREAARERNAEGELAGALDDLKRILDRIERVSTELPAARAAVESALEAVDACEGSSFATDRARARSGIATIREHASRAASAAVGGRRLLEVAGRLVDGAVEVHECSCAEANVAPLAGSARLVVELEVMRKILSRVPSGPAPAHATGASVLQPTPLRVAFDVFAAERFGVDVQDVELFLARGDVDEARRERAARAEIEALRNEGALGSSSPSIVNGRKAATALRTLRARADADEHRDLERTFLDRVRAAVAYVAPFVVDDADEPSHYEVKRVRHVPAHRGASTSFGVSADTPAERAAKLLGAELGDVAPMLASIISREYDRPTAPVFETTEDAPASDELSQSSLDLEGAQFLSLDDSARRASASTLPPSPKVDAT